jgi:hypothetical protein
VASDGSSRATDTLGRHAVNRADLKKLATVRLADAKSLNVMHRSSGAYYLSGYAVECGLKACIARQFRRSEFPDRKLVNDTWTHDLVKLVKLAGLDRQLEVDSQGRPSLEIAWAVVKDWSESARYETIPAPRARDMLAAVETEVLPWIQRYW